MKKDILLVLVSKRNEEAIEVQKVLTEYGCYIKTRLGVHDADENVCSNCGLIFVELIGEIAKHKELFDKLDKLPGVSAKLQTLEIKE